MRNDVAPLGQLPCRLIGSVGWLVLACLSSMLYAAEPMAVEYLWQSQPTLDFSWYESVPVASLHVTPARLSASNTTERMRAAQSIIRVPLSPTLDRAALVPAIIARLEQGEKEPIVRAELFAAVCELDDGQHSATLWRLVQGDRLSQPAVEKACVRWRAAEPLSVWRARLADAQASDVQVQLAIAGVAASGAEEDVELLRQIVIDSTRHSPVRLAAAQAIGRISRLDQSALSRQLRTTRFEYPDYLAMLVLTHSPVEAVSDYAQQLAVTGSPPAQRAAYQWLCDRQPELAQGMAQARLDNADSHIRSLALEQLAQQNGPETLPALIRSLQDPHPDLRNQSRRLMLGYTARSEQQRDEVYQGLAALLANEDWRAVEQAIRLSVELERPERVPQLLGLLDHPRSEICITAGWALRNLATDEVNLQAMLDHLTALTDLRADPNTSAQVDERDLRRMAHLLEAMGLRRFEPSRPLLMRYVPKEPAFGTITRMAAIWACGRMWEDGQNKQLTGELERRIADKSGMFPESPSVRFAATLALGWVADPATRSALVKWDEMAPSPIHYATAWALQRIDTRPERTGQ